MKYDMNLLKRCVNGVLMIIISSLLSSCFCEPLWEWLNPDDKGTLQQKAYEGNEIRIDGCYYCLNEDGDELRYYFIPYRNGVIAGPEYSGKAVSEIDNFQVFFERDYRPREFRDYWGLFVIEDSLISLEYYLPSMYGHHAYLMKGRILNDTTFHMTSGKQSDKSSYEQIDKLFHFCPMDVKPDSTNKYYR